MRFRHADVLCICSATAVSVEICGGCTYIGNAIPCTAVVILYDCLGNSVIHIENSFYVCAALKNTIILRIFVHLLTKCEICVSIMLVRFLAE